MHEPNIKRILLVEDEIAHAELIRRSFETEADRFHLTIAYTLRDAEGWLERETFDLVFTDFLLPDGNGIDLIRTVKGEPLYPVIMLTSHGNEQIAVETLKAGAVDYVVKSDQTFREMPSIARRTLREWDHILSRRRAEAELRESEQRFRIMLEFASEGILLIDQDYRVLMVNRYVEQVSGYSRDQLLGKPLSKLLPEVERIGELYPGDDLLQETPIHRSRRAIELEAMHIDQTRFPVELSLTPMTIGGERLLMCFLFDITERKQLEEQRLYTQALELELSKERELIELRDRFTSMISHEFRAPLSIIASSVQMIINYHDRLSKENVLERLQGITVQVHEMVALLNDVLEVSRNNVQQPDFKPAPLDIVAFCRKHLENVLLIDEQRHDFTFHADGQWIIMADPRLLEHIFVNLLTNAMKYSPEDTTITITLSESDGYVRIQVKDEGIGIPAEDQPHLFKAFYRARNAAQAHGTGLGLAIVRRNVELHGGSISFESVEGKGSTFTVSLPMPG